MMITALAGAFLFFTTGGLMFEALANSDQTIGTIIGSGIFAFLNGFAYLVDLALTYFRK